MSPKNFLIKRKIRKVDEKYNDMIKKKKRRKKLCKREIETIFLLV